MKKVLLKGPVLSRSGYGEQTRFALRSLRSKPELFDIYLLNIPWGRTGHVSEQNEEGKQAFSSKVDEIKAKLEDTQHNVQDKFDHLKEEAGHKFDDAKAKAAELKDEASAKFDDLKAQAGHKLDDLKKAASDTLNKFKG